MPTENIRNSDMVEITSQIWAGMLQIELTPREPLIKQTSGIGACVLITGSWQGAVRVESSLQLARLATAKFLGIDPQEVQIDQIRDAMGELANMEAGSVKPLLPSPCQISLPSVADGTDYTLSVPQGEVVLRTCFEFQGEPLTITVLQRRESA